MTHGERSRRSRGVRTLRVRLLVTLALVLLPSVLQLGRAGPRPPGAPAWAGPDGRHGAHGRHGHGQRRHGRHGRHWRHRAGTTRVHGPKGPARRPGRDDAGTVAAFLTVVAPPRPPAASAPSGTREMAAATGGTVTAVVDGVRGPSGTAARGPGAVTPANRAPAAPAPAPVADVAGAPTGGSLLVVAAAVALLSGLIGAGFRARARLRERV